MSRASLRNAIDEMCKSCIYDPGAEGGWREQVTDCDCSECPLYEVRPGVTSTGKPVKAIFSSQKARKLGRGYVGSASVENRANLGKKSGVTAFLSTVTAAPVSSF
jgi:hypothetical protein